jgi:hypothetical protein
MTVGRSKSIHVFISYRHVDHRVVDDLRNHLGWLENSEDITVFDDRQMVAGDEWDTRIRKELDRADIVVLVVTAAFMRSPYCARTELRQALEMRSSRGVRVIPIIAETCDWEAMPLKSIAALPKDHAYNLKPLNKWGRDRDVALTQIAQQVRKNVETIKSERENSVGVQSRASADEPSVPTPTFDGELEKFAEKSAQAVQGRSKIETPGTDCNVEYWSRPTAEGPSNVDEQGGEISPRLDSEAEIIPTGNCHSGIESATKVIRNWTAFAVSIGALVAAISFIAANIGGFRDTICDKVGFTWCERPCTLERAIKEGCK